MKIGFLSNKITLRGTEVALYDYADLNETLLGNNSIIITREYDVVKNSRDVSYDAYQKFKNRFSDIMYYTNESELDDIVVKNNIDILYIIKSGNTCDNLNTTKCKTIIHCVFESQYPHGDYYCCISEFVNTYNHTTIPVFPHLVRVADTNETLRNQLNIPDDAIVFGTYGGADTFDIEYLKHVVINISNDSRFENIYFIFMNITPFYSSNNRLIFLPGSHENEIKRRFINTCNAMLYGRSHGETFGLACGEFSICNKPIIANTDAKSRFHIELLGEDLIGHTSYDECYSILTNWDKNAITFKNIGYKKYSAEHVMSQFQELINTLIKK